MCRALMPGDEESMSDEAIWETLPVSSLQLDSSVSLSFYEYIGFLMRNNIDLASHGSLFLKRNCTNVLLACALELDLLYMAQSVGASKCFTSLLSISHQWFFTIPLVFSDLPTIFRIAECFTFLVSTKWYNLMIHRRPSHGEASSSTAIRYRDWNSGLLLSSIEDHDQDRLCSLQDIGGHIMKIPIVVFQVLLCMRLEGTPPSARHIPILAVFLPLFLLQGAAILYSFSRLVEKLVFLLHNGTIDSRYLRISSNVHDFFAFVHRGSRLLGWWSIDEGSREEQAHLFHAEETGYFSTSSKTLDIYLMS
ncbi:hypothetical protein ZIOFF_061406 [Zingiber officinale]|uniref:Uncharacterized protein n=1 Tax=Zingiber officinale TaxID=94328 RepID=A0A8J5KEJ5_ZINOF|nr:hypothetical protein ZIOFF_061406 [Zingiber officinale]